MGNWRTVDIRGKIDENDVRSIRSYLRADSCNYDVYCFSISKSLCGLNCWIHDDGSINVSANLSERDFDNTDIEIALRILAERYPSLELTLHSGSDYESPLCSATFHVKNGTVQRCDPEVTEIRPCRCLSLYEYSRMS